MKCYDAIVVGLGGMGSAAVAHLSHRNSRVLGIEQFTPAHSRGSSHGDSRVIRQSYFEHPNYVPLLLRAYELWAELQTASQMDLMTLTGGLMIGKPDSQTIQGSRRSAIEHGLQHEMLDAQQIRARFPAFAPEPDSIGLFESKAGFVRPERCVQAHLKMAEQRGAELRFEEPVIEWNCANSTVVVRTRKETYETAALVLAPGAWAPKLFRLNISLEVVRQYLFWIMPVGRPELFSINNFPIFIWEVDESVQFYGFPQHGPAGDGIKMAVFYNHDPCAPDEMDKAPSDQSIEQMRDCLRDRIPTLSGPLVRSVACMYTNTPDHHFVIGKHPECPNVTLASPCSGHGFKFCSVMGEILSELAIENRTQHEIEMFSPARKALWV
ncbi:MAG: N-methyl-L-tryptophan oxidase [Pirellula sp.]